jgi:hypothetical protein
MPQLWQQPFVHCDPPGHTFAVPHPATTLLSQDTPLSPQGPEQHPNWQVSPLLQSVSKVQVFAAPQLTEPTAAQQPFKHSPAPPFGGTHAASVEQAGPFPHLVPAVSAISVPACTTL